MSAYINRKNVRLNNENNEKHTVYNIILTKQPKKQHENQYNGMELANFITGI